jgi:hypothetical protein
LKVNRLKHEIHEHDAYKLSTYVTENKTLHTKNLQKLFWKILSVYALKYLKYVHTLCGARGGAFD